MAQGRGGRIVRAMGLALNTAIGTFRREYDTPAHVEGGVDLLSRSTYFRMLWQYYDASAFENMGLWQAYRARHRLYRQTRTVYNPTRRLVDFYAGQVYPGVLSEDGKDLPDGVPMAIPLADDTTPEIRAGLGQLWRWSNWQARKGVFVRFGAATGNVLAEVNDDPDEGRVTINVLWPGLVAWMDLTSDGNVKEYALQYWSADDNGLRYVYRKEVTADTFRTYRDGRPFGYGDDPPEWPNPYGFVPAVWCQHKHVGGNYGAPAIYGSIPAIDELNSVMSHLNDQVHKVIGAPILVSGAGQQIGPLFGAKNQQKRGPTQEWEPADLDREGVLMVSAPADAKVQSLAGDLDITATLAWVSLQVEQIEAAHPELAMYHQLREMSQVTGPAAARLMGDVATAVNEAAASYDLATVRMAGMALAIGGYRANRGDWGPLSAHQRVFTPFDLTSYQRGDLDFSIQPRPLVAQTTREAIQLELQRVSLEQAQVALQQQQLALVAAQAAPPQTLITVKES